MSDDEIVQVAAGMIRRHGWSIENGIRRALSLARERTSKPRKVRQSYIDTAISILSENVRPVPISILVDSIRQKRNDDSITRASIETMLCRHTKGPMASIIRIAPGIYSLTEQCARGREIDAVIVAARKEKDSTRWE